MSDTPRTDELARRDFVPDGLWIKHARELERENAELADFVERHEDALRLLRIWAAKPMHATNCDDLREETLAYLKTQ